jgi:hypothetical protein
MTRSQASELPSASPAHRIASKEIRHARTVSSAGASAARPSSLCYVLRVNGAITAASRRHANLQGEVV